MKEIKVRVCDCVCERGRVHDSRWDCAIRVETFFFLKRLDSDAATP